MKKTQKSLSVLLALLMIMSSISCAFVSNAYTGDITDDQLNAFGAVLTEAVYDACLAGTTAKDNIIIKDTNNRDVLNAMDVYWNTIFPSIAINCTSGNGLSQESTERNIVTIKDTLAGKVQDKAAVGDNQKTLAILGYLTGAVYTAVTNEGYDNAPSNVTSKVTINMGDYAILEYDSIDDMPNDIVVSKTYCVDHGNGSYSTGWGPFKKTRYFNLIKYGDANAIRVEENTMSKSTFVEYENVFKSYNDLFNASFADIVELYKSGELETRMSALDAAYNGIVETYSTKVLNKFYGEYAAKVIDLKQMADNAKIVADVENTIVAPLDGYVSAVETTETEDDLIVLKSSIESYYALYNEKSDFVKTYINYDVTKVENALASIQLKLDILKFPAEYEAIKDIMADTEKYDSYTVDSAMNGDYETEKNDISIAAAGLTEKYNVLVATNEAVLSNVIGSNYKEYIENVKTRTDHVRALATATGCSSEVKGLIDALEAEFNAAEYEKEVDRVKAELAFYDDVVAKLNEYKANLGADVDQAMAETIINGRIDEFATKKEELISSMAARLNAELTVASSLISQYEGAEVTLENISSFRIIKYAIGDFEYDLYEYAVEAGIVGDTEKEMYESLNKGGLLDDYNAFVLTNGFNKYKESNLEDIVRVPGEDEVIRDKDFTVDEDKTEAIIEILDKALASKEMKNLGVDLEGLLKSVPDMLYTDDFLNTMIGIFPLLVNLLLPVWDDLGKMVENLEVDVNLDATVAKVNHISGHIYFAPPEQIANEIGVYAFPVTLAEAIKGEYPEVAAVLAQATTVSSYNADTKEVTSPWNDEVLYDEDGKLNLTWGITDKEGFIKAASTVFDSLGNVLLAILSDDALEIFAEEASGLSPEGEYSHLVFTGTRPFGSLEINADVHNLQARVNVDAVNGYNNIIVPVLEALNVPSDKIINGDDLGSVEDILTEAVNIIETVLDKVANGPVDYVASVLPNVVYAIESGAIQTLLNVANIHFALKAGIPAKDGAIDITDSGTLSNIADTIINLVSKGGALKEIITESMFMDNPNINLGSTLDIGRLNINDTTLDLTSLNSILRLVSSLLGEDFNLPEIDATTLATLGELVQKETKRGVKAYEWGEEGKAAFINANKGDVLIFVLKYILKAAADPAFIPAIAKLAGAEAFELPGIATEIINNVINNPDGAIAAIAELVFPVEYSAADKEINWLSVEENEETLSVEYSNPWTRDKAEYVTENFPSFVNNILMISGVKVGDKQSKDLPELIDNLLESLYTPETINTIAAKLSGLLSGLDPKITGLLGSALGIDLTYWNNYNADFEAGNRDQFKVALLDVISPLDPVLRYILAGDNLKVQLTDETDGKFKVVELQGYEAYSYGIVPLVEALGATDVMTPDAFLADKANATENVVDEILSILDKVAEDPYSQVLDLLVNVVYFVASDGVPAVVENLTHGIEALLEVVHPVYPVTLSSLLGVSVMSIINDPISYLLAFASDKVKEAAGITLDMDYTASELFGKLSFGKVVEFTSANGRTAYKVTGTSECAPDVVTTILRFAVAQLVSADNAVKLADLAKEQFNLDDTSYEILYSLLSMMASLHDNTDHILAVLFYIFYGADTAVDAFSGYYKYYAYDWGAIIKMLTSSDKSYAQKAGYLLMEVYEKTFKVIFKDVITDPDLPPEAVEENLNWFQSLIARLQELFAQIRELFQNLFK